MAKRSHKNDEAAEPSAETAAQGKISRKEFEKELYKLQVELTRLQDWVKAENKRIIIVFEGRDTAGKGGVISRNGFSLLLRWSDMLCSVTER